MDMSLRRPPSRQTQERKDTVPIPTEAHGRCYWAPQGALDFGENRREPVSSRPVVSLHADGGLRYILPATTDRDKRFFPLPSERCIHQRGRPYRRDGYLTPWIELIHACGLTEIGILREPERLAIANWLRARSGGGLR